MSSHTDLMKALLATFIEFYKNNQSTIKQSTITIDNSFFEELNNLLADIDDDKKKNMIKIASKRGLKLNPKDVVMVTNSKIVIKKFIPPKPKLTPTQKIQQFKKVFPTQSINKALEYIVSELMKNDFDFSKISNVYFMENYQKLIKKWVYDVIKHNFDDEDAETIELYIAYVLKNYTSNIMNLISEYLIELLIEKDENALKFIAYYDGDVEVDERDKKKYLKPIMCDKNGSKWNNSNVLPVIIQHKKDKDGIIRKKKDVKKLEIDLNELSVKVDELNSEREKLENRWEELVNGSDNLSKNIAKSQNKLTQLKSQQNSNENEVKSVSVDIKNMMREEESIFKEKKETSDRLAVVRDQLKTFRDKKKLAEEMLYDDKKKLRALLKSQESISEKNELVLSAIILTLTKQRTPQ